MVELYKKGVNGQYSSYTPQGSQGSISITAKAPFSGVTYKIRGFGVHPVSHQFIYEEKEVTINFDLSVAPILVPLPNQKLKMNGTSMEKMVNFKYSASDIVHAPLIFYRDILAICKLMVALAMNKLKPS